jgi:uridine phosphorylase
VITAKKHIASNHNDNSNIQLKETAVIFELGFAMRMLTENYEVENEIVKLPCFLYQQNCLQLKGIGNVSFIQGSFGAPAAVDLLETVLCLGVKRIYVIGFCGGIADKVEVGDIIIPNEIIREEGTSYHYLPQEYKCVPDSQLSESIIKYFKSKNYKNIHVGKTVTTDAVYRETINKEKKWRDSFLLGVDMETSAILSVAHYYKIPAVSILLVSDKHYLDDSVEWNWGDRNFEKRKGEFISMLINYFTT